VTTTFLLATEPQPIAVRRSRVITFEGTAREISVTQVEGTPIDRLFIAYPPGVSLAVPANCGPTPCDTLDQQLEGLLARLARTLLAHVRRGKRLDEGRR
jgi:hypothetical protein